MIHFARIAVKVNSIDASGLLLRDAYMHSASLLSKDGWMAGWNDVRHTPVLCLNGL